MKNSIIFSISMVLMLLGTAHAQNPSEGINNYLILSKNIQQLQPAILTAGALAEEDGNHFGEFYIIICGKTVQDIPHNKEFETLLKKAKARDIKVFVCGLSLNKFGVNQDDLPDNLEITKNGILYGFQLSKKGFITLTI